MAAIDLGGLPYSQIGQLQIRSRSGTIPSTIPRIGGWAVDPVAECAFVEDAGLSVPSTAVSIGALKYTPDGALYVTADTTTGPFTNIGGLKVRQDGAACIITKTPSVTLDPYIGGAAYDGATQAMVVGGAGFGFILPLVTTVRPTAGVGVATFTRATAATVEDWETVVRPVLSGEVRFQGARRVSNLLTGPESTGGWGLQSGGTGAAPTITAGFTAPDGTSTAFRVTANLNGGSTSSDLSYVANTFTPPGIGSGCRSIWLKNNGGTADILLKGAASAATDMVTITSGWVRYSPPNIANQVTANLFVVGARGNVNPSAVIDCLMWHPQYEDVTGQSNVNPAEYVSVGVLSTPYHGANVDGVKYFTTQNGNTVASKVVTEATGAAISASIIKGYLAEGARTNLCLQSQAFDNASWTKTDTVITADNATAPDGTLTADLATEGSAGTAFISQGSMTIVAGTTVTQTVWVKRGNFDWLLFTVAAVGATTGFRAWFNLNTGVIGTTGVITTGTFTAGSITAYPNGWYRLRITGIIDAATTTSAFVFLQSATADASGTRVANGTYFPWGAQFEAASFASSYIPTTTVAVTRNADVLTYGASGNALDAAGTVYGEVTTEWATTSAVSQIVGAPNNNILNHDGNGVDTRIGVNDGTAETVKTGLTSMSSAIRKRAASWGTGMSVTGDGAAPATSAFDGTMLQGAANIAIGCNGAGINNWFGTIKNVMISQSQLTDAQLAALTA